MVLQKSSGGATIPVPPLSKIGSTVVKMSQNIQDSLGMVSRESLFFGTCQGNGAVDVDAENEYIAVSALLEAMTTPAPLRWNL
jgi:hypothetical protein